jgi:crotonobetainyl-CoA:carnitine CoA-transferase CaiB-like acyl-CoA transferase
MHGRNKRCITTNLKSPAGRDVLLKLVAECDVVLENFRPGQLEKLGLGPDVLRAIKPNLIVARVSGFGQDGPYRDRAAFGVIGEAVGGLRYLTDDPPGTSDRPPVRVGVSIGDSIAGLYAAFGIMTVLWQRDRVEGDGLGRTVDVALTESVFSMMEGMLPEYGALGTIKQPTGGGIATAAPSNAYPTSDDSWVLIAANSAPLFASLASLIGKPELVDDPDYQGNQSRVRNAAKLDELIGAWTQRFEVDDLVKKLDEAGIPSSKVYTAADCATDPQYRHRKMVREVDDPALGNVLQAGVVPHIPESPGEVRWTGPDIGQHTAEVLEELLGFDAGAVNSLRNEGAL